MEEDKVERFQRLLEEDLTDPEIQYQLALCYLHGEGGRRLLSATGCTAKIFRSLSPSGTLLPGSTDHSQ